MPSQLGHISRGIDGHFGLHALPGDLHEAKFTDGNTACLALSARMKLSICSASLFLFSRQLHVNEINYNDSTEIPQPELPGNFFSSFQVGFQCILLLVIAYAFIAAVYVNYMQGLRYAQ